MSTPGASPVFNLGQYPYGIPNTPIQGINSNVPPSWAISLIEDIQQIKTVIPKIVEIENSVKTIELQMTQLQTQVKLLETRNRDTEESLSFMNNAFEDQKSELAKLKDKLPKLESKYNKIEKCDIDRKIHDEKTQEKLLDLEARSMRSNLIFYGLEEHGPSNPAETGMSTSEDCVSMVKEVIKDTIGIDPTSMAIERAHRLGFGKRPRPIVAKFNNDRDRDRIRFKSYEEDTKKALKEKKLGVGIQTPQPYREARKAFNDFIDKEKINVKTTRINGTKLYINNTLQNKFVNGKVLNYDDYSYQGCREKEINILFWNVNGLGRKVSDIDFINTIKDYDLIFFSETWLHKNVNLNLDISGYESYHLFGNKSRHTRKGRYSGGISIYYKQAIKNYIHIIEKHQNGIIWLELSKILFDFDDNIYLCCTYIPPKNSTIVDINDFDFFEELESGLERYKSKGKCFIFGDFNCRTSNMSDILHYDEYIDPDFFKHCKYRISKDKIIDNQGKQLMDFCRSTSYIIGNELGIGEFTFRSTLGNSVPQFSDHCGIHFSLPLKKQQRNYYFIQ